jgi:DNA replication protein DnaC
MLTTPTLEKLRSLRLLGMTHALEEQLASGDCKDLSFEERLGLMVDRETTERSNSRFKTRITQAKLRHKNACLEDIDYRAPRGLDKPLMKSLGNCEWINSHHNLLITGPTGAGKSFLACALAHRACLEGYRVLYIRVSRLFQDLALGRGDGRYPRIMQSVTRPQLLVLDDFGLVALTDANRSDLLEILEDRHGLVSTVVTSQFPVASWHELIGNPTLADAILDRLVHDAHKITLKGESMRKKNTPLTEPRQED